MTTTNRVAEASVGYLNLQVEKVEQGHDCPLGYKRTEVGVIPEDWGVLSIEQAISDKLIFDQMDGNHGELYPKSHEFSSFGIPYIGATDFYSGKVNYKNCKYLPESRAKKFKKGIARDGDVLFAHNATVGPVALLKTDFQYIIISTTATYYRCNLDKLNNKYLATFFESEMFVKQYSAVMSQSTRNQVPILAQRKFLIVYPTLEEQTAIANTLSDVDALIHELEKLITKKQAIKTATMQQLLTGRTRLPQFAHHPDGTAKGYKPSELGEVPEDWEVCELQEAVEFLDGLRKPVRSSDRAKISGIYPYYGASGIVDYVNDYIFDEELILLGEDGENILSRNLPLAFRVSGKIWVNNHAHVMRTKPRFDIGYLTEFLESLDYSLLNSGTAQPKLNKQACSKIKIAKPKKEEQTAIATLLSDMDKEIQTLQQRLNKTRQIKQGMMQALLTGRIRLLKPQSKTVPAKIHKESSSHNWVFNEAVVIAVLANRFGSEKFPLGRMRYTKLAYLLHRRSDQQTEGYLKKAAGPYNPATRYAGPERIALQNGYIQKHASGNYQGFVAAENIAQAECYFEKWYGSDTIKWLLKQFRYKKKEELELLATVDMAAEELRKAGKPADVAHVKALIAQNPEWTPKLQRNIFSDANIKSALLEAQTLFNMG